METIGWYIQDRPMDKRREDRAINVELGTLDGAIETVFRVVLFKFAWLPGYR